MAKAVVFFCYIQNYFFPHMTTQELLSFLQTLGIEQKPYSHPAFETCDISRIFHASERHEGVRAKNLFLRNKKGNRHFLFVLSQEKDFDKTYFREISGQKCGMADDDRLLKYLGVTSGSVSPLSLIHDTENEVELYLDHSLTNASCIHFHPLDKTQSIALTPEELLKFLEAIGHKPNIVKL